MLYLDNKLPRHPKILKAGRLLGGKDGVARALTLFVDALGYADQFLTDGKIPDEFVESSLVVREAFAVARVLSDRRVRLWHRVRGGYLVHDYHDWNRKAVDIKEKREKERRRKARWRASKNGDGVIESRAESRVPSRVPRARATTSTRTQTRDLRDPGTSTFSELTAHCVRGIFGNRKTPTHKVLCAMLRAELAADPSLANAIEGVKVRLVRQGYAYPIGDALDTALQSIERVRRKASA